MPLKTMTAEEAAGLFQNGDVVACSGFTPAGAPKAVPTAIAERAIEEHKLARNFKIGLITGASTGDSLDGALARAEAIAWRTPYQSNPHLRKLINSGKAEFFDSHLSVVAQNIRYGFLGKIDTAVIEAADVTEKGEIVLTTSVGVSPSIVNAADKVIIELNKLHPKSLKGIHDIYEPADPPNRREIPVYSASDKVGSEVLKVDPAKIAGVVETEFPDEVGAFKEVDDVTKSIGQNVADFLACEIKNNRIPKSFLPLQSGVGNIANAVLSALGEHPNIPKFEMYTEVIQDAVIKMMLEGGVTFASGCSLTITPEMLETVYQDLDFFKKHIILRPQEISNHPEVARRLGIISINTALEVDLFGHINSTQVLGSKIMNGIGGSGDFTRNAYISIFTCPSTAKNGLISAIVPMASHIDHNEHSVQVIVTEQGVADLRSKSPKEKMKAIINNCAHPDYKEQLWDYIKLSGDAHTPTTLIASFGMHEQFRTTGDMRNVDWTQFIRKK